MFLDPDIKMFGWCSTAIWMDEGLRQDLLLFLGCLNDVSLALRQGCIEPDAKALDPGF